MQKKHGKGEVLVIYKFHNTVAAIIEKDRKFLMVEERTSGGIKINQPAGHLEAGESLVDAAIRETLEETGYLFSPQNFLGIYKWCDAQNHNIYIRYAFIGTVKDMPESENLDDGIIQTLWLYPAEVKNAPNHRSIMVKKCIKDYLCGVRYPLELIHELE